MRRGARWTRYHTGLWHAYEPGGPDHPATSICGLAQSWRHQVARPEPGGRACQHCRARLRRRAPSGRRPSPHRPDAICPCDGCRRARREGVEKYVARLGRSLDAAISPAVRAWPGARRLVAEAEDRLAAHLISWEMEGTLRASLRGDLADLERDLLDAWREAERAHDILGGPRAR